METLARRWAKPRLARLNRQLMIHVGFVAFWRLCAPDMDTLQLQTSGTVIGL